MAEEDGFLSRWSRRKRGDPDQPDPAEANDTGQPKPEPEAESEANLAANRAAAEAVDLDTLSKESDMSVFLKTGVPAALRKVALRRFFASSPLLANVDGLVDYGENFADPALNLTTFTSAWKVGRGYADQPRETPPEPAGGEETDEDPDAQEEIPAEPDPPPVEAEPAEAPEPEVPDAPVEKPAPPPATASLRSRLALSPQRRPG